MRGRAVVVGAGVGGLCTAIGLQRDGWSVRVLERWPRIVGSGGALGLWPGARQGLERLGLSDAVARESVPVAAAALYRVDGRARLRVPEGSKRIPDVRLISRERLMELLVEQAGGIEIETGVPADADRLRDELVGADVLIGADGLRSDVRTTFFGDRTRPRYSGLVGWRGVVGFESGAYGETWGGGALFGNTPVEGGRTNFYTAFRVPADTRDGLNELRARFAGWREPIPSILAAARDEELLRNPIHDLHPPLRTFVSGNVVLLGDAAHAMTPHLGRGACEAISDAVALVGRLGAADDVASALPAYDRERRRPAQRIAARSWRAGRVTHATGAGTVLRNGAIRTAGIFVR